MRLSRDTPAFLLLHLLIPSTSAHTLDCSDVVVKRKAYDFSKLGGQHSVHHIEEKQPGFTNFTFTIDLCSPLKHQKGVPSENQCERGTRVCGVKHVYNPDGSSAISEVRSIAGEYHLEFGRALDPNWEPLRDSGSSADKDKDGLRLALHGGRYPMKRHGTPQKAYIEFLCDPDRTGLEHGQIDEEAVDDGFNSTSGYDTEGNVRQNMLRSVDTGDDDDDDEEGDEDDDDKKHRGGKISDPDKGSSLKFVSYGPASDDEKLDILRLEWRTRYACGKQEGGEPSEPGSHWGFFTWFIIILFLAAASYLIFGSWLNYTRYGARGWDLIPHGDTIRDIPYIAQDWGHRVVDAIKGPGSRGGYSAV